MIGSLEGVAVATVTSLPRGAARLAPGGLTRSPLHRASFDWAQHGSAELDSAVVAITLVVLAVLAGWLVLALAVAAARRGPVGRHHRIARILDIAFAVLTPGVAGRVLRAVVGVGAAGAALAGPLAGSAGASQVTVSSRMQVALPAAEVTSPTAGHAETAVSRPATDLDGPGPDAGPTPSLWPLSSVPSDSLPALPALPSLPSLPSLWPLSPSARAGSDNGRDARTGGDVVVLRGDSLWSIAARRLPPGAPASRIDAGWRRIYAMNRTIVGADPNCLLPGQILRVPV